MTAAISAGTAVLAVITVLITAVGTLVPTDGAEAAPLCAAPDDIPRAYFDLYMKAGADYGLPWQLLAAVGKIESDHGRGPGSGIRSGANEAGASGPMQFIAGTWQAFGQDGDGNGVRDVYAPQDAIPAAAAYLRHNGAPEQTARALYRYNHSASYVRTVLTTARQYTGASATCQRVALTGTGRSAVAVRAALHWLGTPYSWGGGGLEGPTHGIGRGAGTVGFDCSGLTRYAWHKAGVALPRIAAQQWRALHHVPANRRGPGDLVFFGSTRAPHHVGILLDRGRMIEAPRTGLRVRVSPLQGRSDVVGYARP